MSATAISFTAPDWLFGLYILPAMLGVYGLTRARATRYAVRLPSASALARAAVGEPRWRRHLPLVLLLVVLALLVVGLARPHRSTRTAVSGAAVILVTEHSASMRATDLRPNRMVSAERAAQSFLDAVPARLPVGLVSFSGRSEQEHPPTTDHGALLRAIDAQTPAGATNVGDALSRAVDLLRRAGANAPAAIVLLADAAETVGRDPLTVANAAWRRGIVIDTVAIGRQNATLPDPYGLGLPTAVPPNTELLARIARVAHGVAFTALDRARLAAILGQLGGRLGSRTGRRDLTSLFVLGSLLLLLAAQANSLRRGGTLF